MRGLLERWHDNPRTQELVGLVTMAFGVVALLALWSYADSDATWFQRPMAGGPTRNWIGPAGAHLAEALLQLFGVSAFALPFFLVAAGWRWLRRRSIGLVRGAAHASLLLFLCALLDLLLGAIVYGGQRFDHPGGWIGLALADLQRSVVATPGAILLSSLAIVGVLVWTSGLSLVATAETVGSWTGHTVRRARGSLADWWEHRRDGSVEPPPEPAPRPSAQPVAAPATERRPTLTLGSAAPPAPTTPSELRIDVMQRAATAEQSGPARKDRGPRSPRQTALPMEKGKKGYSLPTLDLLKEPEPQSRESEQELLDRAQQITQKFREFSIDGQVVAVHPGPVVTTFEFKPEAGVKYSKITNMTDDLSLALKAESVRIDRMVGRSTVGIEVPNRRQETIFPRELIGSERFRDSRSKLTLALGKDIHGEVYAAELDRMPHLLIAGATGAGKSVGLNGMIVSMLYKSTPTDLRFIMIDTKMIELGIYADVPHLLIPVVTDPKHASAALKWAVREMELRYRKLASVGLRNIAQYNELIQREPDRKMENPRGEPIPLAHLPYIVIVIDEMADLMMVSAADVEESVMRLAQMARAVGIHLILATQRPSVDVITGTIKANFPSRIAFRVSQRVDSRTIIDQQGAEHLLGRGDMLYLPTGSSRVMRLHSGFISEPEINRITSFLRRMARPDYDESVLEETDETRSEFDGGERDEMYADAVRTVLTEGKCSITLIQRRLQLGYARAARIVDMMEREGVVSAGEGSKPREILVGEEVLETLEAGR